MDCSLIEEFFVFTLQEQQQTVTELPAEDLSPRRGHAPSFLFCVQSRASAVSCERVCSAGMDGCCFFLWAELENSTNSSSNPETARLSWTDRSPVEMSRLEFGIIT